MNNLNFNTLPDNTSTIKPGKNKCTIVESSKVIASTGSLMLAIKLSINDSEYNVYDNCIIAKQDGSGVNFGQAKLKNILKAINVIPVGDFTLDILPPLITGKSFFAELETQDNSDFLKVKGVNSYEPFIQSTIDNTVNRVEANPAVAPAVNVQAMVNAEFQDEDI